MSSERRPQALFEVLGRGLWSSTPSSHTLLVSSPVAVSSAVLNSDIRNHTRKTPRHQLEASMVPGDGVRTFHVPPGEESQVHRCEPGLCVFSVVSKMGMVCLRTGNLHLCSTLCRSEVNMCLISGLVWVGHETSVSSRHKLRLWPELVAWRDNSVVFGGLCETVPHNSKQKNERPAASNRIGAFKQGSLSSTESMSSAGPTPKGRQDLTATLGVGAWLRRNPRRGGLHRAFRWVSKDGARLAQKRMSPGTTMRFGLADRARGGQGFELSQRLSFRSGAERGWSSEGMNLFQRVVSLAPDVMQSTPRSRQEDRIADWADQRLGRKSDLSVLPWGSPDSAEPPGAGGCSDLVAIPESPTLPLRNLSAFAHVVPTRELDELDMAVFASHRHRVYQPATQVNLEEKIRQEAMGLHIRACSIIRALVYSRTRNEYLPELIHDETLALRRLCRSDPRDLPFEWPWDDNTIKIASGTSAPTCESVARASRGGNGLWASESTGSRGRGADAPPEASTLVGSGHPPGSLGKTVAKMGFEEDIFASVDQPTKPPAKAPSKLAGATNTRDTHPVSAKQDHQSNQGDPDQSNKEKKKSKSKSKSKSKKSNKKKKPKQTNATSSRSISLACGDLPARDISLRSIQLIGPDYWREVADSCLRTWSLFNERATPGTFPPDDTYSFEVHSLVVVYNSIRGLKLSPLVVSEEAGQALCCPGSGISGSSGGAEGAILVPYLAMSTELLPYLADLGLFKFSYRRTMRGYQTFSLLLQQSFPMMRLEPLV